MLGKILLPDDRKALHNFIDHLKRKRKQKKDEESRRLEEERLNSEKGQIFINQKTYELQQALLMPMTESERTKLIKDTIESNLYLLLDYMGNY